MSIVTPNYTNQLRYLSYNSPFGTGPSYTSAGTYFNVGNVGIGNTGPISPLGFTNAIEDKIVLGGTSSSNNYGIGVGNNRLLIHSIQGTSNVTADITLGYGSTTNFNELMRIRPNNYQGNGALVGIGRVAPYANLDVAGPSRSYNTLTPNINNNVTVNGYYSIGIITNNNLLSTTERFKISLIGDNGYNQPNSNGGEFIIYGSFLNNSTTTTANIAGTWYAQNCYSSTFIGNVKFVQNGSSRNSYRIYINILANHSPFGTNLISTPSITFIPEFIAVSDPGADSATVRAAINRFTLTNPSVNVGIGTSSPLSLLHINGYTSIGTASSNTLTIMPGTYYSSGLQTDATAIGFDMPGTVKLCFSDYVVVNGNVGIGVGTSLPSYPLTFGSSFGDRISLWGQSTTSHYGFGIQSNTFDIHCDTSSANIVLGKGSSTSFTDQVIFSGTNKDVTSPVFRSTQSTAGSTGLLIKNGSSFAMMSGGIWSDTFLWPRWTDNASYTNYGTGGWYIRNNSSAVKMFFRPTGNVANIAIGDGFTSPDTGVLMHFQQLQYTLLFYSTTNVSPAGSYVKAGIANFAGSYGFYIVNGANTGVVLTFASNNWAATSDRRIKKNINSITSSDCLEKICSLNPVSYHMYDESDDNDLRYGLLAQEVKEVIPELVTCHPHGAFCHLSDDGNIFGVMYTGFIPFLAGAAKELKNQMNDFKQEVSNMQNDILLIKAKLGLV